MTTFEVPAGVAGTTEEPLSEQPTTAVAAPRVSASTVSKRIVVIALPSERRRRKMRSEASGNRSAVAIPPTALPLLVRMVTTVLAGAVAETASWVGVKTQTAPVGSPLHARLTVPLKPLVGATTTEAVAELPAV